MKRFLSFSLKPIALAVCAVFLFSSTTFGETLSKDDETLLNRVQKAAFDFLWMEANPKTGLVKDRTGNFGADDYRSASVASVGFALAALPVASERHWITRKAALHRARVTLQFFAEGAQNEHGFFYHFLGMNTGRRAAHSELSSIDTALLLAGAIVAREYFKDSVITRYVNEIYRRIDFPWMMNGGSTLSMGWKPESGFLRERWSDFNEGILLTLLAMGSEKNPIPPETWNEIRRKKGNYAGYNVVYCPPLFTHQYPQLFFDLRDKHDAFMDYYQNSVNATLANRKYCLNNAHRYLTFKKGYWGLTASDAPSGYKAYGAEPGGALTDGTVAPTAAITSIMFTPVISLGFLRDLYEREKDWLWGRYGFTDSFNFKPNWKSRDVIGIDQGAILLGIENYRSGLIWKLFSQAPEAKRALEKAGFQPGSTQISLPEPPVYQAPEMGAGDNWRKAPDLLLTQKQFLENGSWNNSIDIEAHLKLAWDPEYLYFYFQFRDGSLLSPRVKDQIWRNDCLEMFIDLSGKGFLWDDRSSVQLGFSPLEDMSGVKTWSWWKRHDPALQGDVKTSVTNRDNNYQMVGKIKWSYLGIMPKKGMVLRLSPAFHDLDKDSPETKYSWHFVSKDGRFELGKVILE